MHKIMLYLFLILLPTMKTFCEGAMCQPETDQQTVNLRRLSALDESPEVSVRYNNGGVAGVTELLKSTEKKLSYEVVRYGTDVLKALTDISNLLEQADDTLLSGISELKTTLDQLNNTFSDFIIQASLSEVVELSQLNNIIQSLGLISDQIQVVQSGTQDCCGFVNSKLDVIELDAQNINILLGNMLNILVSNLNGLTNLQNSQGSQLFELLGNATQLTHTLNDFFAIELNFENYATDQFNQIVSQMSALADISQNCCNVVSDYLSTVVDSLAVNNNQVLSVSDSLSAQMTSLASALVNFETSEVDQLNNLFTLLTQTVVNLTGLFTNLLTFENISIDQLNDVSSLLNQVYSLLSDLNQNEGSELDQLVLLQQLMSQLGVQVADIAINLQDCCTSNTSQLNILAQGVADNSFQTIALGTALSSQLNSLNTALTAFNTSDADQLNTILTVLNQVSTNIDSWFANELNFEGFAVDQFNNISAVLGQMGQVLNDLSAAISEDNSSELDQLNIVTQFITQLSNQLDNVNNALQLCCVNTQTTLSTVEQTVSQNGLLINNVASQVNDLNLSLIDNTLTTQNEFASVFDTLGSNNDQFVSFANAMTSQFNNLALTVSLVDQNVVSAIDLINNNYNSLSAQLDILLAR